MNCNVQTLHQTEPSLHFHSLILLHRFASPLFPLSNWGSFSHIPGCLSLYPEVTGCDTELWLFSNTGLQVPYRMLPAHTSQEEQRETNRHGYAVAHPKNPRQFTMQDSTSKSVETTNMQGDHNVQIGSSFLENGLE